MFGLLLAPIGAIAVKRASNMCDRNLQQQHTYLLLAAAAAVGLLVGVSSSFSPARALK